MKTQKLNYITSNDDLRPSMQHIQFNENGYIYASDGKVLIKSTMEDVFNGNTFPLLQELWDKHGEMHVHSSEWKKIAGKELLWCTVLMESDNKAIVQFRDKKNEYTVTFITNNYETFPICERVIPTQSLEPIDKIGIDGALFSQLTMCVKGSVDITKFKLEFRGELNGIVLTHKELVDTTFLLMPFKVSHLK